MSIMDQLKEGLIGENSVSGPVFLKEDSIASRQLHDLSNCIKL